MAINIDLSSGCYADDMETIREQIKNIWKTAFAKQGDINTDPETPVGQLVDAMTAIIVAKDSELLNMFSQFNPITATGVWQDALAKIYYLNRRLGQPTNVVCICRGLKGTVIPAGSIVQDVDGNQYVSASEYIIESDGKVEAVFNCTEIGPIECPAETLNKIVTVIPGWDSVINEEQGVVGRGEETQSDFEQRRFDTVAGNAHGSAYALEGALKSLADVKDAIVLDNRSDKPCDGIGDNPPPKYGIVLTAHSVGICVLGGNDEEIAKTIYERLDAGVGTNGPVKVSYKAEDGMTHDYKIIRPEPKAVKLYIRVQYTTEMDADVDKLIKDVVYDDFIGMGGNPSVGLAETVYASRFSVCIIKIAEVKGLISIQIGFKDGELGDSITINANEYPTITKEDIEVEVVE